MATVPLTSRLDIDDGGIPKSLQPTQADLLLAAGMMHAQGAFDQPRAPPSLPSSAAVPATAGETGPVSSPGAALEAGAAEMAAARARAQASEMPLEQKIFESQRAMMPAGKAVNLTETFAQRAERLEREKKESRELG